MVEFVRGPLTADTFEEFILVNRDSIVYNESNPFSSFVIEAVNYSN